MKNLYFARFGRLSIFETLLTIVYHLGSGAEFSCSTAAHDGGPMPPPFILHLYSRSVSGDLGLLRRLHTERHE
jgi:hypothetical protein